MELQVRQILEVVEVAPVIGNSAAQAEVAL
jgi:hypothetical protein